MMRGMRIPTFITDITSDRPAFRTLLAACAAIAAAGLDPKVLDPGMPDIRAALRATPDLQSLVLLGVVAQAAFLVVGGVLGDMFRDTRILRLGLMLFVVSATMAIVMPSGAGLLLSRAVAWSALGLVVPYAIGAVARAYDGPTRATALGIVYAVMGGASAAAPALALAQGVAGPRWPAFLACGAMALVALSVSWRWMPHLPGAPPSRRPWQAVTGLWAFGAIALMAAILTIGRIDIIRIGVALGACVLIVLAIVLSRRLAGRVREVPVDMRAVVVVLAVGIVVGFAQVAPTLQLPMFFQFVEGFPPLLATAAIAPFVIALLVAGPVSGMLLTRFQPRMLVAGGLITMGLANVGIALVIGRGTSYLAFIVPFALMGMGFVIATTVRTAVIFASVPRDLPATAAALNESSVSVGGRIGITVVTLIASGSAVEAYQQYVASTGAPDPETMVQAFRSLFELIGLPGFVQLVQGVDEAIRPGYDDAIVQGLRASHLVPGVVALLAGVLAYFAFGRQDPVRSVFDYADERPDGDRPVRDPDGRSGAPDGTAISGTAAPRSGAGPLDGHPT